MQQKKYYSNHCHPVGPQEVLLGTELIKFKGHMQEVIRCGYYTSIPLKKKKNPQAFFNLFEISTAFMVAHYSESRMMKDISDGTYISYTSIAFKGSKCSGNCFEL